MGVAVAVMVVMVVGADGLELGRSRAAVSGLTADGFELNGGVGDVEFVTQGVIDSFEDGSAV